MKLTKVGLLFGLCVVTGSVIGAEKTSVGTSEADPGTGPDGVYNGLRSVLPSDPGPVRLPWEDECVVDRFSGEPRRDVPYGYYKTPSPLHRVVSNGNVEEAARLLDAGADVNERGSYGKTLASYVMGRTDMLKLLIARGVRVNARDNLGGTPLRDAAILGHVDVARVLLDAGANVDACDADGRTPLHYAAAVENYWLEGRRCERLIRLLLTRGADPDKVHSRFERELIDEHARMLHRAATKMQAITAAHPAVPGEAVRSGEPVGGRVRKGLGKQKAKS